MKVQEDVQWDATDRIYDLCEQCRFDPLTARTYLPWAELLAVEPYEWGRISRTWISCLGRAGLERAKSCAEKALESEHLYQGWLLPAELWFIISQYEPDALSRARDLMDLAEQNIDGPYSACCCALKWSYLDKEYGPKKAMENMRLAERLYRSSGGDPTMIAESWRKIFGKEGHDYADAFLSGLPHETEQDSQ